MRIALTVAGSDSGGGAGIQADLKTFHRFGVFGTSVLTLVTAQNTLGVQEVHTLPGGLLRSQLDTVMGDLRPHAVKTGALGSAEGIEAVAEGLGRWRPDHLVVDPVMISKHGHPLLDAEAVESLVRTLLPLATVLTPNLHEAGALLGATIGSEGEMEEAARELSSFGPEAVLIKGGSLPGDEAIDLLWDGRKAHRLVAPKIASGSTHGTGCTFSAAIAACLASGHALLQAVEAAKRFVTRGIREAPKVGAGVGPVNHWVAIE